MIQIVVLLLWLLIVGNTRASVCPSCPRESTLECRGSRWFKVFENDANGTTVFGSKEHLLEAVRSGAEVRLISGSTFGYVTSVQNLSPVGSDDVCAQCLFHISKSGFAGFQANAFWWFVNACTTGHWQMSRWLVGEHTKVSANVIRWPMRWFVRHSCNRKPLFTTSMTRRHTRFFYRRLRGAVESGHCIRITYNGGINDGYNFPADNVEISADESVIGAMAVWHVSQEMVSSPDRYNFQSDVYWWLTIHSTEENRHISRWNVGEHVQLNETTDTQETRWYTDPCWRLAYRHSDNGTQLSGSLSNLIHAVESGHRVRLFFNSLSIEPDQVMVRNGHICVLMLNMLSKDDVENFLSDVHWFWQIACTTGTVNIVRIEIGSTTYVAGPAQMQHEISWFIDDRDWEMVLSVAADGSVVSGSKAELAWAIRGGAEVRYKLDLDVLEPGSGYSFIRTPDNMALNGNEVAATHLRSVITFPVGLHEMNFNLPLTWQFTIAVTNADVIGSWWIVGDHTHVANTTVPIAAEWFVNR